jgi:molybdopterin/thiamine biosynthesis adenylyltransferase
VVFGDVLQRAASSDGSRQVFGVFRESERLIQVLGDDPSASSFFRSIGFVRRVGAENAFTVTLKAGRRTIRLELEHDLPLPGETQFYSGHEGLDERRKGLIAGGTLADKRVVVVGAGSLGSTIALELAQAGVGSFTVLDFDQLDTSNLSRHVCDLSDLGRSKAVALAERLRLRGVRAQGCDSDVTKENTKFLKRWFSKASLVLSTLDVPSASFMVNELVVSTGTPALFVGAYEGAAGAEIIPVRPGGPCLFCTVGFRADLTPDLSPKERRQAYQSADANRMVAEPGLGVDINYIASVAAAHALAMLDPEGSRADLLASDGFTLIHGPSRPRDGLAELFTKPLETIRARVTRDEPCPVCGYFTRAEKVS